MKEPEVKSLDAPDETRPFVARGAVAIATLGSGTVGRVVCEPGWSWAEDVQPIAGTKDCRVNHLGYVISGRMRYRMTGGGEIAVGPGDAFAVPPGHEAWVEGDEPCVFVDFSGMETYASGD